MWRDVERRAWRDEEERRARRDGRASAARQAPGLARGELADAHSSKSMAPLPSLSMSLIIW